MAWRDTLGDIAELAGYVVGGFICVLIALVMLCLFTLLYISAILIPIAYVIWFFGKLAGVW